MIVLLFVALIGSLGNTHRVASAPEFPRTWHSGIPGSKTGARRDIGLYIFSTRQMKLQTSPNSRGGK